MKNADRRWGDFIGNFCPQCGNKLNGEPKFCPECGHKFSTIEIIKEEKSREKGGFWDLKCIKCHNKITLGELKKTRLGGKDTLLCLDCYDESHPKIICPYCQKSFRPNQKRPTTTGGNIARGAIFLPWGVVSAVKNKPFVQCPHCKMKIPQG